MIIVNGDREFAARLVMVERTVIQERSANQFIFERSELILYFDDELNSRAFKSRGIHNYTWLRVIEYQRRGDFQMQECIETKIYL